MPERRLPPGSRAPVSGGGPRRALPRSPGRPAPARGSWAPTRPAWWSAATAPAPTSPRSRPATSATRCARSCSSTRPSTPRWTATPIASSPTARCSRAKDMERCWSLYLDGADGAEPDASPLVADDLPGVAPAYIAVAGHDVLRDDGLRYAQALRAAGVDGDARALRRHGPQLPALGRRRRPRPRARRGARRVHARHAALSACRPRAALRSLWLMRVGHVRTGAALLLAATALRRGARGRADAGARRRRGGARGTTARCAALDRGRRAVAWSPRARRAAARGGDRLRDLGPGPARVAQPRVAALGHRCAHRAARHRDARVPRSAPGRAADPDRRSQPSEGRAVRSALRRSRPRLAPERPRRRRHVPAPRSRAAARRCARQRSIARWRRTSSTASARPAPSSSSSARTCTCAGRARSSCRSSITTTTCTCGSPTRGGPRLTRLERAPHEEHRDARPASARPDRPARGWPR